MACKLGCSCKCGQTGCECWDGIQIKPLDPAVKPEKLPGLANEPKYKCCGHCKTAYCPDAKGHYVVCPMTECSTGHEEMKAA